MSNTLCTRVPSLSCLSWRKDFKAQRRPTTSPFRRHSSLLFSARQLWLQNEPTRAFLHCALAQAPPPCILDRLCWRCLFCYSAWEEIVTLHFNASWMSSSFWAGLNTCLRRDGFRELPRSPPAARGRKWTAWVSFGVLNIIGAKSEGGGTKGFSCRLSIIHGVRFVSLFAWLYFGGAFTTNETKWRLFFCWVPFKLVQRTQRVTETLALAYCMRQVDLPPLLPEQKKRRIPLNSV